MIYERQGSASGNYSVCKVCLMNFDRSLGLGCAFRLPLMDLANLGMANKKNSFEQQRWNHDENNGGCQEENGRWIQL